MVQSYTKLTCPSCNVNIDSRSYLRIYTAEFDKLKFRQEYKLYHCPDCHLEFWHPRKIIREIYEDEVNASYALFHKGIKDPLAEMRTLPFLENFPLNQGKLLDIGCGDGTFLECTKKLGFKTYGIDFDRKSIKIAKLKGLEDLYPLPLEKFINLAKKKNLKFDVITFFAVLEHQDDLKKFMSQTKELLKTNGWIAGSIPNRERKTAKIDHKLKAWDCPPHHFTWWNRRSLKNFLERSGFQTEIYEVDRFTTKQMISYLESILLGNISRNIGRNIKSCLLKNYSSKDGELAILNTADKLNNLSLKEFLYEILKTIRNLMFGPLAILLKPYFNSRGISLYFQGKLKN